MSSRIAVGSIAICVCCISRYVRELPTPLNAELEMVCIGLWNTRNEVSPVRLMNALAGILVILLLFRYSLFVLLVWVNIGTALRCLLPQFIVLPLHVHGAGAGHDSSRNVDTEVITRLRYSRTYGCKHSKVATLYDLIYDDTCSKQYYVFTVFINKRSPIYISPCAHMFTRVRTCVHMDTRAHTHTHS
jgi:hypothetical protein